MRKYVVSTSKGLIHTNDFKSACRILEFEFEEQKRRMSQPEGGDGDTDWDKQFKRLLEKYTPKSKKELLERKYEGGK